MAAIVQRIKDYLVGLGPDHPLVHSALWLHARGRGFGLKFADGRYQLEKSGREMVLGKAQYVQVPVMLESFELFFDSIEGETRDGRRVLDFSGPGRHRYIKSGAEFFFPSIPEDDVMDAYSHDYTPKPGDVVWDAGAHAGASSYFLAQLVGPQGRVYAFEPDDHNYGYLIKNIELHGLKNVIPVKKALSSTTGTAEFIMDGTMCAGLTDCLIYQDKSRVQTVETISFADACAEVGEVPRYVKMDIEGAEVPTIRGALEFLKSHPIRFAIESYHKMDGELTYKTLEALFPSIGYSVHSSDKFGQMFTWAEPGALLDGR
jgi:FkbM family methyltransferase